MPVSTFGQAKNEYKIDEGKNVNETINNIIKNLFNLLYFKFKKAKQAIKK